MKINKNGNKNQIRQGDVLLVKTTEEASGNPMEVKDKITVAYGEVTGHKHALKTDKADWWKLEKQDRTTGVDQFVNLREDTTIEHEEHGAERLRVRDDERERHEYPEEGREREPQAPSQTHLR